MNKVIAFLYGAVAYAVFFMSFLYAIGFVGNVVVLKSIDSGPASTLSEALLVNLALLGLFALQHSGMARQGFKRWWTRIVPQPTERSTYVLTSSLLLLLLFWQWRTVPGVVWEVESPAAKAILWLLFAMGWTQVLVSTVLIDHFDLFGLRQVYLFARGKAYESPAFEESSLYKYVRHPLLLGFIIAFWATPRMTVGHLIFAVATTGYMLIAIQLEEQDLLAFHGGAYEDYRRRVPMLLPLRRRK